MSYSQYGNHGSRQQETASDPFKGMFTFTEPDYDVQMTDPVTNQPIGHLIPGDIVSNVGRACMGEGTWTTFCFKNDENPYDPRTQAYVQHYCPGRGTGLPALPYQVDVRNARTKYLGVERDCANPSIRRR